MVDYKYFLFKLNNDVNNLVYIEGHDKIVCVNILYNLYIRNAFYTLIGEYNHEQFKIITSKKRLSGYDLNIYKEYALYYN